MHAFRCRAALTVAVAALTAIGPTGAAPAAANPGPTGTATTAGKLAGAAPATVDRLAGASPATVDRRFGAPASGPIVIGHRGASGYRPEHTIASYRLAIAMGADYVEPDLVSTKDGVLVARHENEISGTTDVASRPEFAGRKATKTVDGTAVTGWFTEDFTLAELKTLRAKERLPQIRPRNTLYDGRYQVPTFQEVIDLVKVESRRLHKRIGIYPETKHPTYFDRIGLSLEEPLVRTLRRNGLAYRGAPVFIQSFETANLRQLDRMIDVPLVQLIDAAGAPYDFVAAGDPRTYDDLVKPAGLQWIARFADGIGVAKVRIIPLDASGRIQPPTSLVPDAHAAGLIVHAWTFRNENNFLAVDFRRGTDPAAYGDAFGEYQLFLAQRIDGLFSDNPDTAVEAVRGVVAEAA
jgi:glycerophosphoryl diester phosphodiesterase